MTVEQILAQLQQIARQTLRQPDLCLTLATTAADVDGWDSLAHARLILAVESGFAITLPSHRLFDLDSVGDLVGLIGELKPG